MSKTFLLPLSLMLAALALTACPSGPDCEGAECTEADAGTGSDTDAGQEADAGQDVPCAGACTGATPVCDESVTGGVCVGCLTADDCAGNADNKVCDTTSKMCVTCSTDADCGSGLVCDTSTSGGQCVTCAMDADCGMGGVCDTSVAGGACVECTGDANCTAGICDTASNTCVTCTADNLGCGMGEICDTSSAGGQCVTCTATAGCAAPQFCDVTVAGGACVNCTGTQGCDLGETCDTSSNAAGECYLCRTDAQCSSPTAFCDASVAGGECVECLDDAACTDAAEPICDPTTRACRARNASDTSVQIAAVRAAVDGTSYMLPIQGATVTYLKPATGAELAGFFVQAEQTGPAIFVQVDPATTAGALTVGDVVSFVVNEVGTINGGVRAVNAISSATVDSTGANVGALVQDVNAATDLVSANTDYESEVVKAALTLTGNSSGAGSGYVQFPVDTTAIMASPDLRLRVPLTLVNSVDLVSGCVVNLDHGPVWRFNATTQFSAFTAGDFSSVTCPRPTVVSAAASSLNSVRVTFSREIDPASIAGNGSQFTFVGGIAASSASVDGSNPKIVNVTTNDQTPRAQYEVMVAQTVLDTLGGAVVTPNSTGFTGYVTPATLLFNEVNQAITSGRDLIELLVTAPGSTQGITLTQHSSTNVLVVLPDIEVAAGDLIVVHMTPNMTTEGPDETTAKDQSPNATYSSFFDTAWDVRGTTAHITNSGQVLRITAPNGTVQDAIPFTNASPPSTFAAALQAIQAAGLWLPADCGGAPCSATSTPTHVEVSVDWRTVASNGSNSAQRRRETPPLDPFGTPVYVETNRNSDWIIDAQTFGLPN